MEICLELEFVFSIICINKFFICIYLSLAYKNVTNLIS